MFPGVDSKYAVFDKIVPGYYHRRTETGDLCTSACCNNTAPEHLMFERLIVDDIIHWAKTYKVPSPERFELELKFRFAQSITINLVPSYRRCLKILKKG